MILYSVIIFTCRKDNFECCWLDEILPKESHLLLLSIVLLRRLVFPYFSSPSLNYGFLTSFPSWFHFLMSALTYLNQYYCKYAFLNFTSPGELLGTSGCLAVVLSYFCLFMRIVCVLCQTGTLDSILGGSAILSLLHHCPSLFRYYRLKSVNIISWFLVFTTSVSYIYCMWLSGCAALRRKPSRRSWRLGKLLITPGLSPLDLESFCGSVAPTVGSWRVRRYCTLVSIMFVPADPNFLPCKIFTCFCLCLK